MCIVLSSPHWHDWSAVSCMIYDRMQEPPAGRRLSLSMSAMSQQFDLCKMIMAAWVSFTIRSQQRSFASWWSLGQAKLWSGPIKELFSFWVDTLQTKVDLLQWWNQELNQITLSRDKVAISSDTIFSITSHRVLFQDWFTQSQVSQLHFIVLQWHLCEIGAKLCWVVVTIHDFLTGPGASLIKFPTC